MTRKLATKRFVKEVNKHPNADALDLLTVDGWQVVAKLGEFKEGDPCVFFEIDSFLPADDARFDFLTKNGVKKDEAGRHRIRLRTVKLRKELSQGLALPWSMFTELHDLDPEEDDFDYILDITKYERPEPKVANASGNFPEFIRKTDEERVQNLWEKWSVLHKDKEFVPTLKMDGSSCTVAYLGEYLSEHWKGDGIDVFDDYSMRKKAEIICCSRNLRLKYDEHSHFWKSADSSGIIEMLMKFDENIAVQGECCGPGIQGNKEKLASFHLFVFNMFHIDLQEYYGWNNVADLCDSNYVDRVPEIDEKRFPFKEFSNVDEILEHADGRSLNASMREGVVWKCLDDPSLSFKAISNKFLLKGSDE